MNPPEEQQSPDGLDPLPGRLIAGNFRVERLIGQGAMGNVYRAEQLSLGKAVAVKVLHAHLMSDDKLVGRFKREAKSASRLNHPNSIQIIDSGQDADGTLYIAMELLDGRDLAQIIRDEFPLPLPRVVRVMTQVMAALDEAHAQGVIHRDLKPSNIMLIERRAGEKDFVKVCDFGIAKATSADGKDDDRQAMLTIQGLVCGTPEYMSPEQARAEPLDGRADLYSAAIILYQLVTGDIPFKADSPMGIVSRHLAEVPKPPSLRRPDLPIPKALDEIILRGMAKNRDERYPNAIAFRAALEVLVSPSGFMTPVPPGIQAAMPTTPAFLRQAPAATALIPPIPVAEKFGTTTDMTGARRPSRKLLTIMATTLLVGGAAAAFIVSRLPPEHAHHADVLTTERAAVAAPAPVPVVVAPSAPSAPVTAAPEPVVQAPAAAEPEAPAAEAPSRAATHDHNHHHHAAPHGGHAPSLAPEASAVRVPAPAASVSAGPPPEATPPPRGAHEILAEGEKLLSQGEVSDACARGEEAKRLGPAQPPIYKFLGKCYMRAGRTTQAHDNYQKYLELAPTASDAPFIKSMIK